MKRKGYSSEKLAEVCQVSSATISRYRGDKYPNINLPSVISLCIGLKLHPVLANDLLHKAGLSFKAGVFVIGKENVIMTGTVQKKLP